MDQSPGKGPILITGASGGVGSLATLLFSKNGYEVVACTSKETQHEYLKSLGASEILSIKEIQKEKRALESARFGGAIDNLGGTSLSGILPQIQLWGNVACVGLAESPALNSTVMPLILRGVSLLGISSANTPRHLREKIWDKLGDDWLPENLETIVSKEVRLRELLEEAPQMIDQKTTGRTLVKI